VDADVAGEISAGLCVLLGVAEDDTEEQARRLAGRTARLRIFENEEGKFDRSVLDTRGAVLVVSQFTLIADTGKGNRPSLSHAARPEAAEPLYEAFCNELEAEQIEVSRGIFGVRMVVQIENDGPVTVILEN
jgi:D-aminoacyl-tRNA deacylase